MANELVGKLRFTNQGGVVFGDTLANNVALGEGFLSIDTEKDVINIHDGITVGGVSKVQTLPKNREAFIFNNDSVVSPTPIVIPNSSYNNLLANGSISIGSAGDIIIVQKGQPYFHGNKLWEWNMQKTSDDYSTLDFIATTETTIFDQTLAGRNGLFPVLAPGFMLNGFGGFYVQARLGLNSATTNSTFTFKLYLGNTIVASKTVDFSKATNFIASTNLCAHLKMWVDPISYLIPGTNLRTRSHNDFRVSLRGAAGDYGTYENENEVYANIDGTISHNIKLTGQWSTSSCHMFVDGITIHT